MPSKEKSEGMVHFQSGNMNVKMMSEKALRVNCGVKKFKQAKPLSQNKNYIAVTWKEKMANSQPVPEENKQVSKSATVQDEGDEHIGYELRISVLNPPEQSENADTHKRDESTPPSSPTSPRDFFISDEMLQRAKEVVAEHVIGVINNLTKQKYSIEDFEKLYEAVYHATTADGSEELKRKRLKKLIMYCELRDFHEQLQNEPQPILDNFVQHCPLSEDIVNSPRKSRIIMLIQSALMLMTKQVAREIRVLEAKN